MSTALLERQDSDHRSDTRLEPPAERLIIDTIAERRGFAGCYTMRGLDTGGGCMITLWETEQDAELASERTRQRLGARPPTFALSSDAVYEVLDDFAGVSSAERPGIAVIESFDGPLSEAKRVAIDRSHRRLRPLIVGVPGAVRGLLLWQPAQRQIVLVGFVAAAHAAVQGSSPAWTRIQLCSPDRTGSWPPRRAGRRGRPRGWRVAGHRPTPPGVRVAACRRTASP